MAKYLKGLSLVVALWILVSPMEAVHATSEYSYSYDFWQTPQFSFTPYEPGATINAQYLGLDQNLFGAKSIFVRGNLLYICDTEHNRIIELESTDDYNFQLKRVISSFKGGDGINTFNTPTDVNVAENGDIYVADMNNYRIVKMDKDLNHIMTFSKPDDAVFTDNVLFLPNKIAVDDVGRVYSVVTNVNKGIVKYEYNGAFSKFVGAIEVSFDWMDYVWRKIATKEQKAQLESFPPTEYDNLYMDKDGMIFACTTKTNKGSIEPIRKLNMLGKDILVRNGDSIDGDLSLLDAMGYDFPSQLVDVTALDNGVYFCLDSRRGRVFAYDDQGRMLYAFGGTGFSDGYFERAVSLDHMGDNILVLDENTGSITVFKPTQYGALIMQALNLYTDGDYKGSRESWNMVLDLNENYDLAYIGIGRALLQDKEYKKAMEYFKLKYDPEDYSRAFKEYRKEWVKDNVAPVILLLLFAVVIPLMVGKVKSIKNRIDNADYFKYKKY